jgi:hypothetical protein
MKLSTGQVHGHQVVVEGQHVEQLAEGHGQTGTQVAAHATGVLHIWHQRTACRWQEVAVKVV